MKYLKNGIGKLLSLQTLELDLSGNDLGEKRKNWLYLGILFESL